MMAPFSAKKKSNKTFPKSDMREDEGELEKLKKNNRSPVETSTAEKYAKEKGFAKYMECSAKNQKVVS